MSRCKHEWDYYIEEHPLDDFLPIEVATCRKCGIDIRDVDDKAKEKGGKVE